MNDKYVLYHRIGNGVRLVPGQLDDHEVVLVRIELPAQVVSRDVKSFTFHGFFVGKRINTESGLVQKTKVEISKHTLVELNPHFTHLGDFLNPC